MANEFYEVGNSYITAREVERTSENKSKGKGGGSWLVELAMVMGKMADRMGKDLVELAKKIDAQMAEKSKAEANGEAFEGNLTELNAYLNANTQLLNTFMQSISTIIKSIGEGNTQIARKS